MLKGVLGYIPKGSIYCPFKDPGSKRHTKYSFGTMGSRWTLWDTRSFDQGSHDLKALAKGEGFWCCLGFLAL